MWLLSTDRAELHFFVSPEAVSGGYAILSHTWGKHEQKFQEPQALHERCKKSGENPRNFATSKVRKSCILAERHGYRWLWNDTCCIAKTSSSELAEMCFAYLGDVRSDCVLDAPGSRFRTARWHSRGWTLQELIAPAQLIFVSRNWKTMGNKEVTGIWWQVLTRVAHCSARGIPERMSWASKRSTTRLEDEAYCLMGLFNVIMPTIYGEGRQTFQRLQHEIMKQSFDTSLFVWGGCLPLGCGRVTPMGPSTSRDNIYLLAPSPKLFNGVFGRTVRYTPSARILLRSPPDQRRKKRPRVRTHRTDYGVACRFPIIEFDGLTGAVLFCDTGREHLGLLLHLSNEPIQDSSRKKYYTGLRLNGKVVRAQWRYVFIAESLAPPFDPLRVSLWFLNLNAMQGVRLVLEYCMRSGRRGRPVRHWAKAKAMQPSNWNVGSDYAHDC